MAGRSTSDLREELLSVNGIGPETCDSMLLYAFGRPVFVVDAYTRRIFSRHGFFPKDSSYAEMRGFFEGRIPPDERIYNEYHALIVRLGKDFCRSVPRCEKCPLKTLQK
jgi:endonuclease-3 related protein